MGILLFESTKSGGSFKHTHPLPLRATREWSVFPGIYRPPHFFEVFGENPALTSHKGTSYYSTRRFDLDYEHVAVSLEMAIVPHIAHT